MYRYKVSQEKRERCYLQTIYLLQSETHGGMKMFPQKYILPKLFIKLKKGK